MNRNLGWIAALFLAVLPNLAMAEQVEVAPGINVTRKTFDVSDNEAPFFNFRNKTEAELKSDQEFVTTVLGKIPDRSEAARSASLNGWIHIQEDDFVTAAKRFNQAFLLDPNDSALYHGFAVVVASRFNDYDFADELFRLAADRNEPYPSLTVDHARMLLIAERPDDALPLAERAMQEHPQSAVPRTLLAWVKYQKRDFVAVCELVTGFTAPDWHVAAEQIADLRREARCN